jgi:hypothetical protein
MMFGANWFKASHFANNWFGGATVEQVQPTGGWFWRTPRHKRLTKYEDELREQEALGQSIDQAATKPVPRVDPARAAADVAQALAAARSFIARSYVEPGVDLSKVAARYSTVSLPSPLPEDVSDEDAIALILLLAD